MTKASGLLLLEPAKRFPPVRKNLLLYQNALREHQNEAQAVIREQVPKIRAGEGGEDVLAELLANYTASPFHFPESDQFLTDRSREITSITFLIDTITEYLEDDAASDNIKVVDYDNGNDIGLILQRKYVAMLDYRLLSPESLVYNFIAGTPDNEDDFWYNDIPTNGHVGSLLRNFSIFAAENNNRDNYGYLVKLEKITEEGEPTELTAIDDDHAISNQFEVPRDPPPASVFDIFYDSFKFEVEKPNIFVTGLKVVIYNALIPSLFTEEEHSLPESMGVGEKMTIEITGREPATMYYFDLRFLTKVGMGPVSVNNVHFITGPSSEPTSLTSPAEYISTESFQVSWGSPSVIGQNVDSDELQYSITIEGEDGYYRNTIRDSENMTVTFEGLSDASEYKVSVLAFLPDPDVELPENINKTSLLFVSKSTSTSITVYTTPLPPTMLPSRPEEVGDTSMTVRWSPPHLPSAGGAPMYTVEKSLAIGGGELETFTTGDEFLQLGGLRKKTTYAFRFKVETSVGESGYSQVFFVTTKDDQSELGSFRDEVMRDLNNLIEEARGKSIFCASHAETNRVGTLTYEKIFHENNNIPGAMLDTGSGLYTTGSKGTYQVTTNMILSGEDAEGHKVWVTVNGVKVENSLLDWNYDDTLYGVGEDNAGRDIVLDLEIGDTVGLTHETSSKTGMKKVVFCVNSLVLEKS